MPGKLIRLSLDTLHCVPVRVYTDEAAIAQLVGGSQGKGTTGNISHGGPGGICSGDALLNSFDPLPRDFRHVSDFQQEDNGLVGRDIFVLFDFQLPPAAIEDAVVENTFLLAAGHNDTPVELLTLVFGL